MNKLFRSFLLLAALLLGWPRPGSAQVFEWARLARSSANTAFNSTTSATDAAGNTYVAADFQGQLQVGTQTLSGRGVAFIKYDPSGQVLWAQLLTGLTVDQIAVDPVNGGVFIAGQMPPGPIGASPPYYYAKYSAAGVQQWLNPLPSIVFTSGYGIKLAVDGLGNLYLLGTLGAAGTLGGVALDNHTMFLLQTSNSGVIQWVRQFHGDGSNLSMQWTGTSGLLNARLAPHPRGGCLVLGQIYNIIYFGAGNTAPSLATIGSARDALVANIAADGTMRWNKLISGAATNGTNCSINAAAVDTAGNCYVTGGARGAMTFSPGTSTTYGFGLAKYDATGNLTWLQTQQSGPPFFYWPEGKELVVDKAGSAISVMIRDSTMYSPLQGFPTQLGPLVLSAINNIVRYNGAGQPQWVAAETVAANAPLSFHSVALGRDDTGNLYWSGMPQLIRFRQSVFPFTTVLGAQTVVGSGLILTKLDAQANSLLGEVYNDVNGNGQRDAGESTYLRPVAAQVTQNGANAFFPLRADGQLQAFATPGAYTLALATGSLPRYYSITQPASGSYTGSFSGSNQVQTGLAFGIGPIANQPDVRVSLTPYSVVRPGILSRYRVTVENVGTTTAAGTVTATLDSRMTYVSSSPTSTPSGNTLTWNYSGLAPQSVLNYDVQFSLPINVTLGTVLTHSASVSLPGDLTPADNATTVQQTVVSSYDPNDISVNYPQLTLPQVAARQPLDYTVRFQNMGTDTAFAVIIQDTLDVLRLQAGSLQLISQSHNCSWMLTRQGTLTVRLLGVKLPPRNTNVLASQGYVVFRVLPWSTLPAGTIIPNRGHITFDYNTPVRTNTATTTILSPTALRPGQAAISWDAYPNPTTDVLNIRATLPAGSAVTVELLDMLGRPVRQQPLTAAAGGLQHQLNVRELPAGLYLLRLRTPQGLSTGRTIVRQ